MSNIIRGINTAKNILFWETVASDSIKPLPGFSAVCIMIGALAYRFFYNSHWPEKRLSYFKCGFLNNEVIKKELEVKEQTKKSWIEWPWVDLIE